MKLFFAKMLCGNGLVHGFAKFSFAVLLTVLHQPLSNAAVTFQATNNLATSNRASGGSLESSQLERMLSAGEYALAIEAANDDVTQLKRISEHQRSHGAVTASIAAPNSVDTYRQYPSSRPSPSAPMGRPAGAAGGQVQADFTSLINLIETTVDPNSWENAGGFGVITPYTNGVLIDVSGRLGLSEKLNSSGSRLLSSEDQLSFMEREGLSFLSLPKLEREIRRRSESGQGIDPALKYLNGIYDIKYVMIDRDNNDLLLVGPAGPWEFNQQGIAVNLETGKAVMQLDDLVVCLRTVMAGKGVVGCSIDPRPGQFAEISKYLKTHHVTSEKQRQQLRTAVGPQDAVVFGVPATSHTAQVLLTADYHLKLLAMGNVSAGRTLPSYLDLCNPDDPPTEVIRWWFTLGQPTVEENPNGDIFVLGGNAMQLKTENQMVNRQKAGQQSLAAAQFVSKFNRDFDAVQRKFPLYGQLENIFELAIAAQVLHSNQLPQSIGWNADFLVGAHSQDRYQLQQYRPITEVELVVNHRNLKFRKNGSVVRQTITAISGGVDLAATTKQIQRITKEIENREIPADFYRSLQSVQSDPTDQPSDHFRWSRQ